MDPIKFLIIIKLPILSIKNIDGNNLHFSCTNSYSSIRISIISLYLTVIKGYFNY